MTVRGAGATAQGWIGVGLLLCRPEEDGRIYFTAEPPTREPDMVIPRAHEVLATVLRGWPDGHKALVFRPRDIAVPVPWFNKLWEGRVVTCRLAVRTPDGNVESAIRVFRAAWDRARWGMTVAALRRWLEQAMGDGDAVPPVLFVTTRDLSASMGLSRGHRRARIEPRVCCL